MNSKTKIIEAAIAVFATKGKHGARMEEVAAKAGLNKAMVYYYFGDKDNLFRQCLLHVFAQIFSLVLRRASKKKKPGRDPAVELEQIMRHHFKLMAQNPLWPRLIFSALINEEEHLKWAIDSLKKNAPEFFPLPVLAVIERGIAQKKFRPVDPKQTAVSLAGTNVIYFLGRPLANILLGLEAEEQKSFLAAREESVVDLILHGILQKKAEGKRKIKMKRTKS